MFNFDIDEILAPQDWGFPVPISYGPGRLPEISEFCKNKNIIKTDSVTAELVKYMNNSFFATKVSIMNEFKLLSRANSTRICY